MAAVRRLASGQSRPLLKSAVVQLMGYTVGLTLPFLVCRQLGLSHQRSKRLRSQASALLWRILVPHIVQPILRD